jgi:hypothetical protein
MKTRRREVKTLREKGEDIVQESHSTADNVPCQSGAAGWWDVEQRGCS